MGEQEMKDMMRCAVAVAVVLVAASVGADDIKASVSFGKFGSVDLIQRDGAVQITANLTNLPPGQHVSTSTNTATYSQTGALPPAAILTPTRLIMALRQTASAMLEI